MVFHIVSTHIRKNAEWTKLARLLPTALCALSFLSACGSQDDASAQSNFKSTTESNKNLKGESGSVNAGQAIFERANCAMCHPGGNNTMDPGHPIKGPEFARKYSQDAYLESTIRKGFPNVGMPSFSKKQIDDKEMKDLIAYVRSFTAPIKLPPQKSKSPAVK